MNFFHSHIDPAALARSQQVLESGFVSEGDAVAEFERRLTEELGLPRPVTVNSGTSALHLALEVIGAGEGDEVVIPAQTFIATAQAVLMCGARPVFADVSPEDGNLTTEAFANAISPRCKAVIPVHWGGYPCDMDRINEVAEANGVRVIEDAAHALGATYRGRPVGMLSSFTAFSFQAIKHLTTGDGGALCCARPDDEHFARTLRWFGIDRTATTPNILGERDYDLRHLGFKYHMNNVAAAVGLGNLETFRERLARHREIAGRYSAVLGNLGGLRYPEYQPDRESAWWFFPLLVERREDFVRAMHDRDVPCSVVHRRIDTNSLYEPFKADLPGQEIFDQLQINLPVHIGLTDADIGLVIDAIHAGW